MELPCGEPDCGPWLLARPAAVLDALLATGAPPTGPRIVAIDGRGGSGKSTLAGTIADAARRRGMSVEVVHTDDVAWHHSRFAWDTMLAEHILEPVRRGRGARFRPPAWAERGRSGAVTVSAEATLVVVEGSGAARRSLAPLLDATVWMQVDAGVAADRLRNRDGDTAANRAFVEDWAREEGPFMLRERPWSRCTCVVNSTDDGRLWLGRPALPY